MSGAEGSPGLEAALQTYGSDPNLIIRLAPLNGGHD